MCRCAFDVGKDFFLPRPTAFGAPLPQILRPAPSFPESHMATRKWIHPGHPYLIKLTTWRVRKWPSFQTA